MAEKIWILALCCCLKYSKYTYCCTYYILIYALHIMDFSRFLLQSIKLVIYFFVQVYCLLPSSLHQIALFLPWPVFILYILTLIYIYSKTTWVLWKNNLQASWDLVYVKIVCFVSFCASMPWQTWIEMQFFHRSCGIKKFVISIYFVWMFHDKHELRWRISTAMLKGNIILMCHKSNYGHGKYFDFSFVRYRNTTKSFFCSQNLAAFPIT